MLNRRGTAKPPQHAGQAQHQLALDRGLGIELCRYRHFECLGTPHDFPKGSTTVSAVSPCRTAFWRERSFPTSLVGPVLLSALRRLASICLSDVIVTGLDRLRFVVL